MKKFCQPVFVTVSLCLLLLIWGYRQKYLIVWDTHHDVELTKFENFTSDSNFIAKNCIYLLNTSRWMETTMSNAKFCFPSGDAYIRNIVVKDGNYEIALQKILFNNYFTLFPGMLCYFPYYSVNNRKSNICFW